MKRVMYWALAVPTVAMAALLLLKLMQAGAIQAAG